MKIGINSNVIAQILLGIFTGWIIGIVISWINVFGYSGHASLICAISGGIYESGRLIRQQKITGK